MGKLNWGQVLLLLAWFSVGPPAWTDQTPASAVPAVQASTAGNLRVLFVGNSFTHQNDLPGLTARLAASTRPPRALETQLVEEGGATLKRHWEAGRALEAIRKGKWDYVVLQGQGSLSTAAANTVPLAPEEPARVNWRLRYVLVVVDFFGMIGFCAWLQASALSQG